jgi:hypothetical protein
VGFGLAFLVAPEESIALARFERLCAANIAAEFFGLHDLMHRIVVTHPYVAASACVGYGVFGKD